jgi:hypothetical protein
VCGHWVRCLELTPRFRGTHSARACFQKSLKCGSSNHEPHHRQHFFSSLHSRMHRRSSLGLHACAQKLGCSSVTECHPPRMQLCACVFRWCLRFSFLCHSACRYSRLALLAFVFARNFTAEKPALPFAISTLLSGISLMHALPNAFTLHPSQPRQQESYLRPNLQRLKAADILHPFRPRRLSSLMSTPATLPFLPLSCV